MELGQPPPPAAVVEEVHIAVAGQITPLPVRGDPRAVLLVAGVLDRWVAPFVTVS